MTLLYALLISGVILAVGVSVVVPAASVVAGALTLGCAVVGLLLVGRTQRLISILLIAVGVASLGVGVGLGASVDVVDLFAVNQDLVGMLTAVSFLRLITPTGSLARPRLRGRWALLRTAVATHALGSVINIGAIGIVGDHLRGTSRLRFADAVLLSRSFTTAAYWSPFWAATAAATTLVPGANTLVVVLVGLGLAVVVTCVSLLDVMRLWGSELADYSGYALSWAIVRIPLALVALVVTAHGVFPRVPVPRIVLLAGLGVTLAGLLLQDWRTALRRGARHARHDLPTLRGEVTLFASAGILAVGLRVLFPLIAVDLPFDGFTVLVAWLAIMVMVLFALVGVHPVVSVAVVAAIVLPLDPDPTLFVLAACIGWGTGTAVGPLSGLTMFLGSRYGIDTLALTRRNLVYLAIVLAAAWPALLWCAALA
ncbi:hypothetical protein D6T64_18360 [Cryobacterium melibiosiphilum]|uniref:Uncharacterized protein n=1 Tax=Cryobacterium melibiosiphilum TaxID=995039 RepID=A0A3A5M9I4_9MICO|nr:hypothetical protein [Cryobacterium melibiosiphilum]RJT86228.1 hypothetical protein D6T64_18360 [Cryobacterium melibiosiphilum]